jgi:hypothetical protein
LTRSTRPGQMSSNGCASSATASERSLRLPVPWRETRRRNRPQPTARNRSQPPPHHGRFRAIVCTFVRIRRPQIPSNSAYAGPSPTLLVGIIIRVSGVRVADQASVG